MTHGGLGRVPLTISLLHNLKISFLHLRYFKEVQSHLTQTHSPLYLLSLCSKRTGPWTVLLGHFPVSAGQAQAGSHSIPAVRVTAPGKVLAVKGRSKAVATLCCSAPKSQGVKVKPPPKATLSLPPQENANRMPHMQCLMIQPLGSARREPQQLNRGQMLHGKIYP